MSARPAIRCAIYTRKSTLEGLEQDFNSLDAQHEACAAYVASQRHEGWRLSANRYDDGGISGGTLRRPALQRLLSDIDTGRITMVVVYKIDRLTRSLTDFTKMVERFDATGCSFVSVTQAFNTSTSMGRLTLNVLLSFAQFEREVTAERIRDKIAASKKKGMWMGGLVPLGYDRHADPKERGLVVNSDEAETVRTIFGLYEEHGCLRVVHDSLKESGIRSKHRIFASGKVCGGGILSRSQIHFLLTNPIYIGLIRHKEKTWPGQHDAIIDQALWDRVQAKLQTASVRPRVKGQQVDVSAQSMVSSPLTGKFRDETGDRLTPTHTTRRSKRLRYYVSNRLVIGRRGDDVSGWRLPAPAFERSVVRLVSEQLGGCATRHAFLCMPDVNGVSDVTKRGHDLVRRLRQTECTILRDIIASGRISPGKISIELDRKVLAEKLGRPPEDLSAEALAITAPFQLRRRGVETRIVVGQCERSPDAVLLRILAKAHLWVGELRSGKSLKEIARSNGHSASYVRLRAQLAFLSPRIQAAILEGTQPVDLSVARIVRKGVPMDWAAQAQIFCFER